ncbi:MAG: hypothetical protein H6740_07430 [Alphaproteobacteria bacterium]|nr:hypothetical protein [Alphaproteobacteria bacterium]
MSHDHPIRLTAPIFLGGEAEPALILRTDQSFVEGLFRDLRSPEGLKALADRQVRRQNTEDANVLYQPVHRCHTLVLVEAWCDVPGKPPVDRKKIESAGLVMRRVIDEDEQRPQRWISKDHVVLGWQELLAQAHDDDPDPERRGLPSVGDPEIDRRIRELRGNADPYTESVTRLHVAPPDVCAAVGRTLLFGVVPTGDPQVADSARLREGATATAERPVTPGSPLGQEYSEDEVYAMTPSWLRRSTVARTLPPGLGGYVFEVRRGSGGSAAIPDLQLWRSSTNNYSDWTSHWPREWLRESKSLTDALSSGEFRKLPLPGGGDKESPGLGGNAAEDDLASPVGRQRNFITMLWQLRFQLRAFEKVEVAKGQTIDSDDAKNFRADLDGLTVRLVDGRRQSLYEFLELASLVLVMREPDHRLVMPETLPPVPDVVAKRVEASLKTALQSQLARLARNEGRFDNPEAGYQLRAFIRAKREDGCPCKLVWTEPTASRRVARWYEGGPEDAVLPRIELPSIDRGFLKGLKPNVAVQVPPSLFNFIQNNAPKNFLEPENLNKDDSGLGIQWICGFNISIIFIIAFMLLITFVLLLNIVFWWIFFFRICIPLPSKK